MNIEQILWVQKDEESKSIAIFMVGAHEHLVLQGAKAELFWKEFKSNRDLDSPRHGAQR